MRSDEIMSPPEGAPCCRTISVPVRVSIAVPYQADRTLVDFHAILARDPSSTTRRSVDRLFYHVKSHV